MANNKSNLSSKNILKKLLPFNKDNDYKSNLNEKSLYSDRNFQAVETYFFSNERVKWASRTYNSFAKEGYIDNVIVHRCVNLLKQSVSSVPWKLFEESQNGNINISKHPVLKTLQKPNPFSNFVSFIESIIAYKYIAGNAFILKITDTNGIAKELYPLNPQNVKVICDNNNHVTAYSYRQASGSEVIYPVNKITGKSDILHIKNFNPLDENIGLSAIEPAAYSIDQHNQAAKWNQSLLQNGAKPSGALVVHSDRSSGDIGEEQFSRLRQQLEESFSGHTNAGKPLLLEGGLDWKEMSLSPKDMDFIEAKNSAAREIALAFAVPSQLLGIPGDNTYSNLAEARLAMWEQTILPLIDELIASFSSFMLPDYKNGKNLSFTYDKHKIPALMSRYDRIWQRLESASFLTDAEKRQELGYS